MLLQFLRTADIENLMRHDRAFRQLLALLHVIAFENNNVLADRNEVFLFDTGLGVLDENAALAAHARTEVHHAVNLRNLGGVLRTARLEQFRHARQTAGDVFGLRGFARDLREHIARVDFVRVANHQVRVRRHQVLARPVRPLDLDHRLPLFIR